MQSKITFLLPLFHGNHYFRIWLKNNYKKNREFKYFFADGSGNNNNYKILKKINKINNFRYKKFPEDKFFPKNLVIKIRKALEKIRTKYVMLVDVDDFINFTGVEKIIQSLDENKYNVLSGDILYVSEVKNEKYRIDLQSNSFSGFTEGRQKENIIKYLTKPNDHKHSYIFYSIYKKEILLKVYKYLERKPFLSPTFYEIANTVLSFYYGKFKYLKTNHLIRLNNPKNSFNKTYKNKLKRSNKQIINLKKNLRKDQENLEKLIETKFQIEKNYSKKLIWSFFNSKKIPKTFLRNFFHRILSLIKLNFSNIKLIFNIYYFLKINK